MQARGPFVALVIWSGVLAGASSDAACLPRASNPSDTQEAILKGKEIACVMTKFFTSDAREVAKVCEIADTVLPFVLPLITDLISVRDAARRTGVVWHGGDHDGGLQ